MVKIENMITYRVISGVIMCLMTILAIFGNIIIIITLVAVRKKNPGYFLIACKCIHYTSSIFSIKMRRKMSISFIGDFFDIKTATFTGQSLADFVVGCTCMTTILYSIFTGGPINVLIFMLIL